ncbi:MAG TPA: AMP-dependent synthetase/ligase [Acidimicrobiales bacterium]|nr:AMP-dependent synthetase/ligase [Acidimicrobiales bacterium]
MAHVSKAHIDKVVAGQTVTTQFAATVAAHHDRVALRWHNADDSWGEWTWGEYSDAACRVAAGLAALGVQRGDRVVLMMRNRPEFHIADLAVLLCGATPVSIYNSSAPEQVQYLTAHCEAKVAIVEDAGFLERFSKVRADLPDLAHIVVIDDADTHAGAGIGSWESLGDHPPVELAQAAAIAQPDDLVTLIYTSGTTGPPKAVMLTHYNIVWTVESYLQLLGERPVGIRAVSYLPMAHIAERMTGHYLALVTPFEVTTCPDPSLLGQHLVAARPQTIFGVPRVWEKIYAGVNAALAADPEKQQKFDEAVAAAIPIVEAKTAGTATKEQIETWDFLDAVAFKAVRELIGLDQAHYAVTGAAPIPVEVIQWFRAIGVPMSEIYGMSENAGPMTWEHHQVRVGTVGRAMPGVEVKLLDDGEVVCRGGNVFAGYLKDEEKTAEALDGEWLHTGDIGQFDEDGYLKIVDRKKELIITAGGKNISPANIEAALKSFPLIGQAAVIGDKRPFISALVVLDPEVAPAWAKNNGIESSSLAELAEHPDILAEVQRNVDEANRRFSKVEGVKRFKVLGAEWLPDSEELTPTMKLKRRGVNAKYAEEIEALYS